jgi:hypothetical protein
VLICSRSFQLAASTEEDKVLKMDVDNKQGFEISIALKKL